MKSTTALGVAAALAVVSSVCARGESAAEDIVEIKAAQHPDGRGGLMLKIRTNGGEWRDAAERDRVFAHSNLGNWGEKNLLDPVLYHDDDGTWHVYYKDRPEGGKYCHAVSWGKDNLTDWGRQNWVDNDLDRARMKKAREGIGIWRLTKTQVEKLGKSEWHPGCPWHFALDSAKDDEQRYGEAVREAKPGLRLKFTKKPAYSISSNLMGVFFEDINSSHEVYSTNHVGTYKGHGFRKDIGEALEALKPRFVRFPGGCIVDYAGTGPLEARVFRRFVRFVCDAVHDALARARVCGLDYAGTGPLKAHVFRRFVRFAREAAVFARYLGGRFRPSFAPLKN